MSFSVIGVVVVVVIQGLCGPCCRDGPGGCCGCNGPRDQRDPCGPSRQLGTNITQPQENKPMFIADCAHTIAAFIIDLTNAFLSAFFYQMKEILNTLKAINKMMVFCVCLLLYPGA